MSQHLSACNISSKSMHAFLSNLANRQTDRKTHLPPPLSEVTTASAVQCRKTTHTQVNSKGAPLRWTGMKIPVLDMQVPRADRLWPQTIEQCHLCARRNAHCLTVHNNIMTGMHIVQQSENIHTNTAPISFHDIFTFDTVAIDGPYC